MKKISAIFLLLCLLLTMLPAAAFATETTEAAEATEETGDVRSSNQCGADMTWQFDGTTLTITPAE